MWSSEKKIHTLHNNKKINSLSTDSIIFVDNEPSNFNGYTGKLKDNLTCSLVGQCNIQECKRGENDKCNKKFEHTMQAEKNKNVFKHYLHVKDILLKQKENFDYFDGMSGVIFNTKQFKPNPVIHPNENTIYIFDWDRTLTQVEGFLFHADTWEEYYSKLKRSGNTTINNSARTHLKMMCGGSERYNAIRNFMQYADPQKIYILTNNRLLKLIRFFTNILNSRIPSKTNVHSMYHKDTTKINWIKNHFHL